MRLSVKGRITEGKQIQVCLLFAVSILTFSSCTNDIEKVHFFDRKSLPYQQVENAAVIRSEQGRLQLVMKAPVIEVYQKPENKTVYPKGIKMHFYEDRRREKAFISADYGVSFDDRNLMEARGHVVIIDYQSGDTSYLSELIWNAGEHRIYSNNPVRSVNGPRVTLGDGFESDENFENPVVIHQRGTVIIQD